MRLLIVEDEPRFYRYYAKQLDRMGADYDIAESKVEAVECLKKKSYEGAIVDLNLTDDTTYSHGISVLEYARTVGEGTQCFVVSGASEISRAIESWEAGAVKFIEKASATNQEIAERVYNEVKDNHLDVFGKFKSLNVYLAHPNFAHEWEMMAYKPFNFGFQRFQQCLMHAFKPILPVIRPAVGRDALAREGDVEILAGTFWSKKIGCAVRVEFSEAKFETEVEDDLIVVSSSIGNDAFYRVYRDLKHERDEFPEFIDQTPWAD